ncbi:LysR family transcriptional regulator [Pseudovibrio brasiliensis]|uniref:LysR family transcriptional regulator n=1 Tax=Pseudovibrio brasiliensis TaxID=1898042 RepID=A0ABX8ARK7_9HYPH|nr:LysR family transcriptional regulator [Pseudovibrio brasiliensis]QUS57719.1 LysR family transcriptional regulator [Pseudovibrio brasiliensis]
MKLLRNNLLEAFCAVVECGGFSEAQFRLGISQSAISCRIRDLEIALGYRVCERGRSGFQLTERGKIAYEKACEIIRMVEDFDAELLELRGTITGQLRIGIVDTVISLPGFPLVPALQRFFSKENDVNLEIVVTSPNDLKEGLITGSLHIALAPFKRKRDELEYIKVCSENHFLYCGREHELFDAGKDEISPEILSNHAVCQRSYDMIVARDAKTPEPKAIVTNMEAAAALILSGKFLGVLPDHYATQWVETGNMRLLEHPNLTWTSEFYVASRKSQSHRQAVEWFIKALLHDGVV